jgi:hypothetical protein
MRHHNPARWSADDCFGRTTPDDLVQPGVTVGAHDQKVDRVGSHNATLLIVIKSTGNSNFIQLIDHPAVMHYASVSGFPAE